MSLKTKRLSLFGIARIVPIVSLCILAITIISVPVLAQQGFNFAANLTGKDMLPPVNSSATGVAKIHINPNGGLCYYVDVRNITGVLGAHVGFKNGTELAALINPYAVLDTQQAYPTGPVNGILTDGEIKAGLSGPVGSTGVLSPNSLHGPLIGKNVTDLDNIIKSKDAYATVRTTGHERGEIQGQILRTSTNVDCLSTLRFAPPTTSPSPLNAAQ